MVITELTRPAFDGFVDEAARPVVLVEFLGGGCRRCRELVPVVRDIAIDCRDRLVVALVNVDLEPELASRFHITCLPTIIGFRSGRPVARVTGAFGRPEIDELVRGLEPQPQPAGHAAMSLSG
jgi:thioredoxin 1